MTHDELREAVARATYESMAAVANAYDILWRKLPDDEKQPFRETAALFQSIIRNAGFTIVPPMRFLIGQRVRKIKGSSWQGPVRGFYSTELTPEGYAVESERELGSVQVYPASALEAVPEIEAAQEGKP